MIEELERRHFESYGENVWQVVSDIYNETDLVERLRTRMKASLDLGMIEYDQ